MNASHPELEQALQLFESNLRAMAELSDPLALATIEREADALLRSASPAEQERVRARLNCMLGSAGLVPSDNEGEACS